MWCTSNFTFSWNIDRSCHSICMYKSRLLQNNFLKSLCDLHQTKQNQINFQELRSTFVSKEEYFFPENCKLLVCALPWKFIAFFYRLCYQIVLREPHIISSYIYIDICTHSQFSNKLTCSSGQPLLIWLCLWFPRHLQKIGKGGFFINNNISEAQNGV